MGMGKKKFMPTRKTLLLKSADVNKEFEEKVVTIWEGAYEDGEVWEQYKCCVLKAADEVCG